MTTELSPELIQILVCPANRTPVRLASPDELAAANERQASGALKQWDGNLVEKPLQALLIRQDGKIAYRVQDGIPVMLVEEAVVLDESAGSLPAA